MDQVQIDAAASAAKAALGVQLFLVFGSRARGDAGTASDWDFGYIALPSMDADALLAALVTAVGSDRIDLVDLNRAGGLLRYRAARDGRPMFEARPGLFAQFWVDAVSFWCDVEPILRTGYDRVLEQVGR